MGRDVPRSLKSLRLAILGAIILLLLGKGYSTIDPPILSPQPVKASSIAGILAERKEFLVQEALVYAFQEVTAISSEQARGIVELVIQESPGDLVVLALIVAESNGNWQALSPVGARGLMQILPQTGRFIAQNLSEEWEGNQSLYEVDRNIRYGIWYLNYLREQFPGNTQASIAAYNWGPENIRYRLEKGKHLPRVFPNRVRKAEKRLREKLYDFYATHFWGSLDLTKDLSSLREELAKSSSSFRSGRLTKYDAESQLLRQRRELQPMLSRLLRGDRTLP